jgi:hypothetical protein
MEVGIATTSYGVGIKVASLSFSAWNQQMEQN